MSDELPAVNLYIDHTLPPEQLVGGVALSDMLSQALSRPVQLHDTTAWGAWSADILLRRLLDSDYIEFSSENGTRLDVWVTVRAISIECLDPEYQWEDTLRHPQKLSALYSLVEELAQLLGSRCALVAPSSGFYASAARELFAEAMSVEDLIVRVDGIVGAPFKSQQDGVRAIEKYDAGVEMDALRRGYFVWRWPNGQTSSAR